MSRLVLILIVGGFITFGIINVTMNKTTNLTTQNAVDSFDYTQVRNVANSSMEQLVSFLADSADWRVTSPETMSLFGGTAGYTVIDTTISLGGGSNADVVKITVDADFNGYKKRVVTIVSQASGFVPPTIRAAWTANGPLNKTISDMYIDGRDHDLNWNYMPHTGVYGVSTSQEFTNTENAEIGGTKDSVDYNMSYPENPNVVEENYNWGGTFPTSPDQALGLAEGTLKSIAQSGINGSQYATKEKDLNYPLSGVTYLELGDGKSDKIDMGKNQISTGILVIHNPTGSTQITQTKIDKGLYFQGLIIGDYMFHFHLDVLGAILLLSPNLETSHECNGNKDHKVYYSSAAIVEATSILGASGASSSYTGGHGTNYRSTVLRWYE